MKDFTRYQLPLFIWAFIIYWLSSLSKLPNIKIPIIAVDKLAHMTVYFVFCWLSQRALYYQTTSSVIKKYSIAGSLVITIVYGYLDEVHQLYVPGRTFDYFDLLADATGALLFIALFFTINRWSRTQARTG